MCKKCVLLLLLLPGVLSCVREVILDAGENPQVVVECVLSDESVQTLYLTYTKGASCEAAPDMSEAGAVLTDLTAGQEAGNFERAADGTWQLAYAAVPTHSYRLDVTVPGHDPIWAEQTMPNAPDIDVQWDWWREDLPDDAKYRKTHGYVFSADTLRAPVWFYGINRPEALSAGELTERLYTDYPDVDVFNQTESAYWLSEEEALWGSWFRVSTYPELEGGPCHRRYLRFPVREGGKTEFLVSGSFRNYLTDPVDFINSERRFAELHWFSASEDYDRYLTESWYFGQKASSRNLADIFLRENIYSNIQGAIGIFGARVERSVRWDDDSHWGNNLFFLPGLGQIAGSSDAGYYQIPIERLQPFQLLLMEIRDGYPAEWKYGLQGGPSADFFCIENEEQMQDHGIEVDGLVDFSTKNVWVVYTANKTPQIPFFVGVEAYEYMTEDGQLIYTSRCVVRYLRPTTWMLQPTSTRIALVVNKEDKDAYDLTRFEFLWYFFLYKPEGEEVFRETWRQLGLNTD